jgi:hypothetical protein
MMMNSTFQPFPSSVEGLFEHLSNFTQAKFSNEPFEKHDKILKHQSELVGMLEKMFRKPLNGIVLIDDFDELFSSLSLKICWAFTLVTKFPTTIIWLLFILFEKYGEDSMKRSLYNRLNSQCAYPVIISSLFCTPAWTWRVYIGPLSSVAADFTFLIGKIFITHTWPERILRSKSSK